MGTTPVNFTAKSIKDAQSKLNDLVDEGIYNFSRVGVMPETVHNVRINSDGSKDDRPETVYRFVGLAEAVEPNELKEFKEWKSRSDELKSERDAMNRKLNLLNGKAFGPLSIFLLVLGLITGTLGILALVGVLPIPSEQIGISIALSVVGVLAITGSILVSIFRDKKIKLIQKDRGDIENENNALLAKENKLFSDEPIWHAGAQFKISNNLVYNNNSKFDFDNIKK